VFGVVILIEIFAIWVTNSDSICVYAGVKQQRAYVPIRERTVNVNNVLLFVLLLFKTIVQRRHYAFYLLFFFYLFGYVFFIFSAIKGKLPPYQVTKYCCVKTFLKSKYYTCQHLSVQSLIFLSYYCCYCC